MITFSFIKVHYTVLVSDVFVFCMLYIVLSAVITLLKGTIPKILVLVIVARW